MLAKVSILLLLTISFVSADNWAVLIAGSNTFSNYRHQADVLHMYQVLMTKGFDQNKIITFAYDDIASYSKNPFPGKVFNKPTYSAPGIDVYAGAKIDYKGNDVNPTVFLNVLQGNKAAVKGKGSQKVLESTNADNVFMFFSDHGAPGLIAFPSQYLYADQLLQTFASIRNKYKKFVFYLETCESGSMFQKLPNNTMIYAVSAANPTQSSWGTYCSPDDVVNGKHIGSCLGDLFSVKFIEQFQGFDMSKETLAQNYLKVKAATTQSHVMQWGDLSFVGDSVGQFIQKTPTTNEISFSIQKKIQNLRDMVKGKPAMFDSRMNKVKMLVEIYTREKTQQAYAELREQMSSMQRFDSTFARLASNLNLSGKYKPQAINFDCLRSVMEAMENKCGRLSDYGLMYVKYFAEACQLHHPLLITSHIHC